MLTKESELILKTLKDKAEEYRKNNNGKGTVKIKYYVLKELFPADSHALIIMRLNYLLEKRYIYNHIAGREHEVTLKKLDNGIDKLLIGDKGVSYLDNKKFRLFAKVIPLSVSVLSLFISFYSLFF